MRPSAGTSAPTPPLVPDPTPGEVAGPDLVEAPPARRRSKLWWLLGVVVLGAGAWAVTRTTEDELAKSETVKLRHDPAPAFTLGSVDKDEPDVSLSDFEGRPVVLNFFGSWCAPCLRELPDFQAVSERYEGEVAFVGIAVEDTRKGAADILEKTGVTYPAAFDADSDTLIDYAVRGMPTTVFISADGRLLERAERALSESQLEAIIERLFVS